jgi:cell filamentation protein
MYESGPDPYCYPDTGVLKNRLGEGNGRTQLTYLTLLAASAGHPLALERMDPNAMLAAMVKSFKDGERPLAALIAGLIAS